MESVIPQRPELARGLKSEMYRCFLLENAPHSYSFAITPFSYSLQGETEQLALLRRRRGRSDMWLLEDARVSLHRTSEREGYFVVDSGLERAVIPRVYEGQLPMTVLSGDTADQLRYALEGFASMTGELTILRQMLFPGLRRRFTEHMFGSFADGLSKSFPRYAPRVLRPGDRLPEHRFLQNA